MATDYPISIEKYHIGPTDRGFVLPPIIGIGSNLGDTVTWTNNTHKTGGGGVLVRLWFPNGAQVFDPATSVPRVADFSDPITIAPLASFRVAIKALPVYGYYKYSVYCEGLIGDHAQGNSEPGLHVP